MAFPVVQGSATTDGTVASPTPVINLPTGVVAGELLLVLFRIHATGSVAWPAGWTELAEVSVVTNLSQRMAVGYRLADGSEAATISLTTSSGKFAAIAHRISGSITPSVRPPEISHLVWDTDDDFLEPPRLMPTGGPKDYLWFVLGGTESEETISETPSADYSGALRAEGGALSCSIYSAWRQLHAAAEQPGFWELSEDDQNESWTLAVHPPHREVGVRQFFVYHGEDKSPFYDYTDDIRWGDAEFGGRAHLGEATSSSVVVRDPDGLHGGTKSLWSHNVAEWYQGSNTMWRGRIGAKDYSRGPQAVDRYREATTYLEDYNVDLRGMQVVDWVRGGETDYARVQGLLAHYASGSPRATTILNGSNFVSSANAITLAAKTYTQTDVLGVLSEIAGEANKTFFVTVDGELFYAAHGSVIYRCPYRISDRENEVRASNHVFAPIWDSGSAVTEDGQQLLSGLYLYYSGESYVYATSSAVEDQYGFWEDTVYDNTATVSNAATRASAILARRKTEDRTVNVTIGPLTDAHIGSIKWGQVIAIKARAIPDADDAYVDRRIVQLKWTTPVPGVYFAHMQLGHPQKIRGYGSGNKALVASSWPY